MYYKQTTNLKSNKIVNLWLIYLAYWKNDKYSVLFLDNHTDYSGYENI